jgi:hypothetical protein
MTAARRLAAILAADVHRPDLLCPLHVDIVL